MDTARHWVIGRAPDCDIAVDQTGVSGRHCCLTATGQGFFLEDLHSSNGTYVNGTKIASRVKVSPSDRITLGRAVPMPWPASPMPVPAPPPAPVPVPVPVFPPTPAPGPAPAMGRTQLAPASGAPLVRTVGRGAGNDIRLDYPTVSSRHARILIMGDHARIEDLGSSNGTAIGHPDRKITQAPLTEDDVVFFGSLRVPAARLLSGKLALGEQPHQTIAFRGEAIVFGRDPGCTQVLDSPMVSRRHARLTPSGSGLLLEDLGSANGTFLNGERVRQPVAVRPGDRIGVAGYTFTVNDEGQLEKRDLSGNLTLEAHGLTVDVPGRRLIENVSLTIYPSEFVGLMGTSGAGKTTLMNTLNGYTPPTEGEVLLNGQSLYANYGQFANHLGYVPQDDIIHRDLTVGQALYYTAKLRLPRDSSDADIRGRVQTILKQLELEATADTLIGSAEKKGISGGQRRRVNLAMELLTDPLVLFLDEPTSGLSSEDALLVMQVLKKLAEAGKTILITIHQPSLEVFRLLTHLAIVSKDANSADPGRLVYYGPAYPDAVRFFNPPDGSNGTGGGAGTADEVVRVPCPRCAEVLNVPATVPPSPDEVLRGLARSARAGVRTADWEKRYAASEYHRKYVEERAGQHPPEAGGDRARSAIRSFGWSQWWTLVCRCLAIKARDRANLMVALVTAFTIACLVWLVFGDRLVKSKSPLEARAALAQIMFILALGALWFGTSSSVREIVGEWAIYRRERMVNLKIVPYVASKFTVFGLLCVVQCVLLLGIAHWGCELKASWLEMFGVLLLTALVGVALGLMISALASTPELAGTSFTLALLSMIILGGALLPVRQMSPPVRPVCYAIPSRWAFEAMLVLEAKARPELGPVPGAVPPAPPPPGPAAETEDMAEQHFPKKDGRVGTGGAAGTLGVLLVILVVAVHLILKARDIH